MYVHNTLAEGYSRLSFIEAILCRLCEYDTEICGLFTNLIEGADIPSIAAVLAQQLVYGNETPHIPLKSPYPEDALLLLKRMCSCIEVHREGKLQAGRTVFTCLFLMMSAKDIATVIEQVGGNAWIVDCAITGSSLPKIVAILYCLLGTNKQWVKQAIDQALSGLDPSHFVEFASKLLLVADDRLFPYFADYIAANTKPEQMQEIVEELSIYNTEKAALLCKEMNKRGIAIEPL